MQIISRDFLVAGPRWIVRSIYWYTTTSRGQSGLAWDRFPRDILPSTPIRVPSRNRWWVLIPLPLRKQSVLTVKPERRSV